MICTRLGLLSTGLALLLCTIAEGVETAVAREVDELPARVLVKLRPANPVPGISAKGELARMRERPSEAVMAALRSHAGPALQWAHALSDGTHVFIRAELASAPYAASLTQKLRSAPEVAWAEEDRPVTVQSVSDPYFPQLWSLKPPESNSFGADFTTAWQTQLGVARVRVAIIDTGILPHPDIVAQEGIAAGSGALASEGYDFISDCRIRATCPASTATSAAFVEPKPIALDQGDWITNADRATDFFSKCKRIPSSWHGSHTAGVAAALANNEIGVAGAAFGTTIVPVRVLGKCGGYISDVAEAIRWAAGVHPVIPNPTPAHVLNLSFGALGTCGITLQSAIDAASAAGALIVVAAGNDADDAAKSLLPSCSKVVVAAASTLQGDLAYYSNYSASHVAIAAPGGDMRQTSTAGILSLSNIGATVHDPAGWTYAYAQGTSMAAPHVAAAAALMLSRNSTLSPAQLTAILTAPSSVTAFPAGSDCATNGICGAGLLNAQRAVSNTLSALRALPTAVDFGSMALGSEVHREVLITNHSSVLVSIGSAALAHAGFALFTDECSGQTLSSSETCRLVVSYAASTEGIVDSALHVPTVSDLEGATLSVSLTGLVGSRLTSPTPVFSLGEWVVGETKRATILFEGRYGEQELLAAAYLVGSDAVISGDSCSNVELLASTQCQVEVTITPSSAGDLVVQLVLNTAGVGDVPYSVTIAGNALQGERLLSTVQSTKDTGGGGAMTIEVLLLLAMVLLGRFRLHS